MCSFLEMYRVQEFIDYYRRKVRGNDVIDYLLTIFNLSQYLTIPAEVTSDHDSLDLSPQGVVSYASLVIDSSIKFSC